MNPRKQRTGLRVLLLMLVMTPVLLWSMSSSALYRPGSPERTPENNLALRLSPAVPMPPPKADLDQVRNGTFAAPIDPPDWVNGNAGQSNAHYFEGESIPYRLRLSNIALTTHVVEIEWDIKHSGTNAIDYITHYDRISETVLPCLGIAGCNEGVFTTFAIPAPSSAGSPVAGQPTTSFNALPAGQRVMTIYNGSIQSLTYVSQGNLAAAQSATRLQINFTATSPTVVIAWGGHIAASSDWNGNSASGISGSPYHTRLISFDGSGGNQDRSLSANAVQAPGGCQMSGPTVVCESDASAHYQVTNPQSGATYTWEIINNTTGAGFIGTPNGDPSLGDVAADVNPGTGSGSYTVKATPINAGGSGASCEVITSVQANTSTTDLQDGQVVCPGTNVNFSTTASGGDGNCSFSWTLDGGAIVDSDNSVTIDTTSLAPGTHTVEVSVDCNCGPPAVQSATFEVLAPVNITDEVDNAEACFGSSALVPFSVTASGSGTLSYAWTLDGNPIGGNTSSINVDPSALSVGSHAVAVSVTSDSGCLGDSSSATLTINANPTVTITLSQECDTAAKLTASGNFASYAWSGPTPAADQGASCGTDKNCLFVDKTGVYTVNVTDGESCQGSQTAQLCFTMASPAPSAPAPAKAPAQKSILRGSLISMLVRVVLWPF